MVFHSSARALVPAPGLLFKLASQLRLEPQPLAPAVEVAPNGTRKLSARALHDFALIERITVHNDEKARVELLAFYHEPMLHFVRRFVRDQEVAEDLAMEIFTRMFNYLKSFRPEFAFSTWLFRLASNYCIDYLRRRRLQTVSLWALATNAEGELSSFDVADTAPTPYEVVASNYRAARLRHAVNQLPLKYRQLVDLRYFQELSYDEIAVKQHLPLGTVKAQLHHCRKLLYQLLKQERDTL